MIPKVIHYCWFGNNPKNKLAEKCIASWKKMLPGFEIIEWNDLNYNVEKIPYTRTAFMQGKYAFVSDYARYDVLYHHGGLYFDTDVEIIKPFDDILQNGPFLGFEKNNKSMAVNPGLGMGAEPFMNFYRQMLDIYEHFTPESYQPIDALLIKETTRLLKEKGLKCSDMLQTVDGITIYPNDFFNPLDDYTGRIRITSDTHSIHYYAKSWIDGYGPIRVYMSRSYHRLKEMWSLLKSSSKQKD